MLEKIKSYVKEHKMLQKEDCVIIGVSGGADSVCLLFVLLELQKSIGFRMVAVHVNHGLRGEDAKRDEDFVKELCLKNQIEYLCYEENVELLAKKWKQSTEEAGRNFRKMCFEKTMESCQGTKIALAHHKNDSVETFLMNLSRGTGLKGLGGISPIQGNYIRPLLCVERSEIEAYLQEHQISYCIDETNAKDDYTRNRVRNHVIPYLEEAVNVKTVSHMDETMAYLRDVQAFLEEQKNHYLKKCVREEADGYVLDRGEYILVPKAVQPLIIKHLLVATAECEKDLEAIHIQSLEELLEKQVGRKVDLPYNMEAKRVYQGLWIGKKKENPKVETREIPFEEGQEDYEIAGYHIHCRVLECCDVEKYEENSSTKWFDYDIIKDAISFRLRRPGDYITISEDGGTQKLKAYFINNKIPQEKRDDILLIADGSHILCIWGYRENCAYRVTEHTKHVLEIKVDEGEKSWQKQLEY